MTRIIRNFVPNLPVHVVHRGNNRQCIFSCDGDYLLFRRHLQELAGDLEISIHSYVLMSNHVHLLMTPTSPTAISKLVQRLARRYVGYFNSRYERTGTLWEGRFHSSLIANDFYLLACHRYIENNPVRAGIVGDPASYAWSSHRANAFGALDDLLTPHPTVIALSSSAEFRCEAYRAMFRAQTGPELEVFRASSRSSRPIGLPDSTRRKPGRPVKETRL